MNNVQKIVLRRLQKIDAPKLEGESHPEFVASLNKNLETIGFTFSAEVLKRLITWNPEQLLAFAKSLIPQLLKMVGGDVKYQPMYPNFPLQVMETDETELYLNAILHYYGDSVDQRILPKYNKKRRPELLTPKNLKVLELASDQDIVDLCRSMVNVNTSLSKSDCKDLRGLLEACKDKLSEILPDAIPFKEVQAVVCVFLIERVEDCTEFLRKYLRTPTDLLRFATELSLGDSSLAAPTKFKSFPRKQRRAILGVLEHLKRPEEDLNRHRGKWVRLAERLHPGEFSKRFPSAFKAITKIRNGERIESFNSKIESLLRDQDVVAAVDLLKSRPGELARRLDYLLRTFKHDSTVVLEAFQEVASAISTPVLLQLISHFQQRALDKTPRSIQDVPAENALPFFESAIRKLTKPVRKNHSPLKPMRTVFPKGQISKLVRIPLAMELLEPEIANAVVDQTRKTLVNRFHDLPPLGKCFVAPELVDFVVPFSQRSANKSLRTLARGSRLPLPAANVVRFFLWWKEGNVNGKGTGRVDLDLSATLFRDNWSYLDHISYTNLKSSKTGCCHSGDITSAPKGASEFIDIDLERLRNAGGRYAVCSIQSFTSHPFCDLPQCYVGWMARKKPNSGEIYEPATVQDKIDLASNRRVSIPFVIDLEKKSIIWADLALQAVPSSAINIESNQRGIVHYGVGIESMVRPTLFELFSLHVEARGKRCDSADEADSVYSINDGTTPFDFEQIASDYLL